MQDKKYTDVKENLKSLTQILYDLPENGQPFYLQKSTLCIFRFEDVLFNLYPHFASMRRKGMSVKEIFLKNDPNKESLANNSSNPVGGSNLMALNNMRDEVSSLKSNNFDISRKNFGTATKSLLSGNSNRRSD